VVDIPGLQLLRPPSSSSPLPPMPASQLLPVQLLADNVHYAAVV
jgi:hypothetical protein